MNRRILSAGAAAAFLLLGVSAAPAATVWEWSDGSGLSAQAELVQLAPKVLRLTVENTSTALPAALNNASAATNQMLTAISLALPGKLDIVKGAAVLGAGAATLNFDQINPQLTEGGDVSAEWGFGKKGTKLGLAGDFISSMKDKTKRFDSKGNLDDKKDLGGPEGGLVAGTLLAPLDGLGAICGPVVFTLTLKDVLDFDRLNPADSIIRFGKCAHFITGAVLKEAPPIIETPQNQLTPEPGTAALVLAGAALWLAVRRRRPRASGA